MQILDLAALLVCVTAALAFVNARYWRLPASIGVTVGGLGVSLIIFALVSLDVPFAREAVTLVRGIEFNDFVFEGVLSFLLFAGALGVNSHALWGLRGPVLTFALLSTAISIALVGGATFVLLGAFGLQVSFIYCLLFGALISPTDPVAVLGMLKQAGVPKRIETLVAGESLFNDGVGVVAFAVLAGIAAAGGGGEAHGPAMSAGGVALFFAQEALGGLALGLTLGWVGWLASDRSATSWWRCWSRWAWCWPAPPWPRTCTSRPRWPPWPPGCWWARWRTAAPRGCPRASATRASGTWPTNC